jgi:hypothetical protein
MKTLDFTKIQGVDVKNYIYSTCDLSPKDFKTFDVTFAGDEVFIDIVVLFPITKPLSFKDALTVSVSGNSLGLAMFVKYNKFSLIRQITIL